MHRRGLRHALCWMFLLSAALISCTSPRWETISLASFTENDVEVLIKLERFSEGKFILSGTFTPPEGYHLYSKDIPLTGVDGLGRPTLLELPIDSQIKTAGELTESVQAQEPGFEPRELLVYPAGAVTLSLPVELPPGSGWMEGEVQVTYMACSAGRCRAPVLAKRVLIPIPSADVFHGE